MEHTISLINSWINEVLPQASSFLSTTPGHVIAFLILVWLIVLFRYFFNYLIKQFKKEFLYKHRDNPVYRMLFYRAEKVIEPFRYLISLFLLQKAVDVFFPKNSTVDFVFFLLFLFTTLWWIYEIVKFFLYGYLSLRMDKQKSVRRELFNLLLNITKIILLIIGTIIILSRVGVDVSGLVTSLGVGGLVLGFSAKETLTNFFDSIRLVAENAFNLGDWIVTDDVEGLITEIGLAATKIRTFDNALVTIPNSKLANGYIKNWSKRLIGRRIKFDLKIKQTYDTKELRRVMLEIKSMLESNKEIMTPKKIGHYIKTKQTYKDSLFDTQDTLGVRSSLLVYFNQIDEYSMNIMIYTFSISVVWEDWLRVKQDVLTGVIDIISASTLKLAVPAERILLEHEK